MTDIVDRLWKTANTPGTLAPRVDKRLLAEAAQEIEALRAEVQDIAREFAEWRQAAKVEGTFYKVEGRS